MQITLPWTLNCTTPTVSKYPRTPKLLQKVLLLFTVDLWTLWTNICDYTGVCRVSSHTPFPLITIPSSLNRPQHRPTEELIRKQRAKPQTSPNKINWPRSQMLSSRWTIARSTLQPEICSFNNIRTRWRRLRVGVGGHMVGAGNTWPKTLLTNWWRWGHTVGQRRRLCTSFYQFGLEETCVSLIHSSPVLNFNQRPVSFTEWD